MLQGDIKPEEKNAKAVEMIPILASTDGYVLTDDDMKAAKIILEANCDMQPHNAIQADDIVYQLETDGEGRPLP